MSDARLNKAIAGYHILMILSAVDFKISVQEDLIIRDYIAKEFPFRLNMDNEIAVLSNLLPDEWEPHFFKCMDDFYNDALESERKDLLQFALDLAKADKVITIEENKYLNMLFNTWFPE